MNLGEQHGPLLVFGGAYSNLPATRALQAVAKARGISPSHIFCTGDCVAYCGEPEATVRLLRDWGIHCLMGNCEESLATGAEDCGCGFEAGSACDVLTNAWYPFALNKLSNVSRAWMKALPHSIRFSLQGRSFELIHGGVSVINRFVFASTPREEKKQELELTRSDGVIGGHCGIPFGELVDDRAWLNAGAIGMPANDGTRDGWYLLLTPGEQGITASWHRLAYPAEEAYEKMQREGLVNAYADALLSGLWPSMDVLPEIEQRSRGRRLSLASLLLDASQVV